MAEDSDKPHEQKPENPLTGKVPGAPPKVHMPEMIDISLIDTNPLSANEEDSTTFNRLVDEISDKGLIEIPVVTKKPDGRYLLIAGKHRTDAFRHLGGQQIAAIVIDRPPTKEEEFNLVNNMNLIKGDMRKRTLVKIIKDEHLDPIKIDLLKLPSNLLIPTINESDIVKKNEESQRNARLNELVLVVAKEIAGQIMREKDEILSLLLVKDDLAAVIRVPFKSKKIARLKAEDIKKRIENALADLDISGEESTD